MFNARNVFRSLASAAIAASLSAPIAVAHDEGDDHDHAHHHGPVVQPKDFDHATDLIHEGLTDIEAAIARGDMSALHTLSDGVAVPARQLGKLAARRSGVVPANIRAINNVGRDLADLVDAMHVAADGGKSDVVMAKWKELEAVWAQFSGIAPRGTLTLESGPAGTRVVLKDAAGQPPAPGRSPDVIAISKSGAAFFRGQGADGSFSAPLPKGAAVFAAGLPRTFGASTLRAVVAVGPDEAAPSLGSESSRVVGPRRFELVLPEHVHPGESVTVTLRASDAASKAPAAVAAARGYIVNEARTRLGVVDLRGAEPGSLVGEVTLASAGVHTAWFAATIEGNEVLVPFVFDAHDDHDH